MTSFGRVSEKTGREPLSAKALGRWKLAGFTAGGLIVGALIGGAVRGFFPPFVLDDAFWRAFWSGPPVAGIFAIVAATIAFFPAFRSTLIARESAKREQWWLRTEWALGLASSDSQTDREVANDALSALVSDATETEGKMIYRIIENLQNGSDVDNATEAPDNKPRRWWLW